ncbi:MAG TPA: DUF5131 family protein, partial [Planctomycetota bacterium]|nr:DUF5131 family protein [Planctomycetota bacterium]
MNRTKIGWCSVPGYVPCSEQLVAGCTRVSAACDHCYAAANAWRMANNPNEAIASRYRGLVTRQGWTGEVRLLEDVLLEYEDQARHVAADHILGRKARRKPRCIFWCSMGDLFHEAVPAAFIRRAYMVFSLLRYDLHIVCTKRPHRIVPVLYGDEDGVAAYDEGLASPNVWHLTTVEDQRRADERVPHLLALREYGPWPVLGLSCEPILGPLDLGRIHAVQLCPENPSAGKGMRTLCPCRAVDKGTCSRPRPEHGLDWVIAGGETGPYARETDLRWLTDMQDDCVQAGVPYYLKQLGDAR